MNLKRNILSLVFSLLVFIPIISQEEENKSATDLLWLYFDNVFGDDERLITGHYYHGPTLGPITGHPYYLDESWKIGTIEIDDVIFDGLQVKYDIYLNWLILNYTSTDNAVHQIGLNSGKINRIKMSNSEFIPLPGSRDSTGIPFAELISDGPVQYLVTKSKSLEIANNPGSSDYEYKEYIKQYLYYNGTLQSFRTKNTLYKTFPGMKSQLKRFARQNYLYFIRNRIDERKKLVDYCNSIVTGNNENE